MFLKDYYVLLCRTITFAIYQIWHFLTGFIGEPSWHWNADENSSEFDSVPITRIGSGECGSFSIC